MRKVLLIVLAAAVVAAAIFAAAKLAGPRGPKVKNPFTFDFDVTQEQVRSLIDSDDMAILLASSPFYPGRPLPGQQTYEFDEARARKVDEIIADSDALAASALKLKPKVDELRTALLDYLTVCINNEPKAEIFVKDAGAEVLRLLTLEAVAEARYKSFVTESENDLVRSNARYMKTVRAVELASLYLQDIDTIVAFAAMGLNGLADSKNPRIEEANKKLDSAMGKFDAIKGDIEEVMAGIRKVNYGFKQLATADYYFARAAVKFMRDSIPDLQTAIANAKPNKHLEASTIALAKDYLAKFDNVSAGFQEYLDSVPQSQLIPVSVGPSVPGSAFAAGEPTNDYASATISLQAPARDPGEKEPGWLATGWNGVKKFVHGTQSVLGTGIDIVGTGIKNLSRIPTGIYYGNSVKEIWDDMKKNSRQIKDNWDRNLSGAETMRTANQYLNAVDDGAEWLAESGAEHAFGKGWISWGTGKVGRALSGLFTGLGKGITLVGNRDAQTSDYLIGGIEIASSALGGSKLIIKGSQLPGFLKGLGKGTWLSGKGTFNSISKIFANMEKAQIEALFQTAVKYGMETGGFKTRRMAAEALIVSIEQANKAVRAELANLIKEAAKAGAANFTGTLRDSLTQFVRKEFARNIGGLAQAIGTAIGKSATEVADNIIAQWAEDALKDMVDQAMAEPPLPEELKGRWSGTTVFTSITFPESVSSKAQKEGCDLKGAIKALENKPLPTTMQFDGVPSGNGRMVLQMSTQGKQGSPVNASYKYSKGTLTISQGVEGGHISMTGQAKRMTQGYTISGSVVANVGSGDNKITMRGNFKVTKPF